MKLITAVAAVLTSALLTVPTVTEVGVAKAADIRVAIASAHAEVVNALA